MNKSNATKQDHRNRRRARVRARIVGNVSIPRLNVHRSLTGMTLQLIDDENGKTLISVNNKKDLPKKLEAGERKGKVAIGYVLGKVLAEKAKAKKIEKIVFDRAGYKYHGRVKAVAEGARDGGLIF